MKKNKTHVSIVLDRTGSMEPLRDDTIGGFNAFLNKQKKENGEATLSLIQFDSQDPFEIVHDFLAIKEVPELTRETFVPRAATPLLDAIGRSILDLERQLRLAKEQDRPSKVVVAVITDGQENASQEYSKDQIRKMIDEKSADDWQFVFLSSDLDSYDESLSYGFRQDARLHMSRDGYHTAFQSLADSVSYFRCNDASSMVFSEEDQKKQDEAEKV
ncbi:MAG: vWA domain-containing protein [Candidatus Krumholzibacteria bacterium]|jgi:hypothetical protein|nr:vWA domain-containing protein [Candidatus Krumholzibacteria bacterium]MDP6668895.1 vWA domain-containing protein [Candidatus Krumholzibacteria bacterium]MDP6797025.1 vWA domain-containing protein [Candidatus Krumholzibacteria bacterium]MDP7022381.1 vWA domain-containing protein [Candidatus Krumholzibacteria bacterium]